jgi:hypothetical protein
VSVQFGRKNCLSGVSLLIFGRLYQGSFFMGFFGKKVAAAPASVAPPSTGSGADSSARSLSKTLSAASADSPRTVILSFMHEASKTSGMREFVKNYVFNSLGDNHFLVVVELKDSCASAPPTMLLARWQLLQLAVMRYARSKSIPLSGIACIWPLDKTTPLPQLQERAQIGVSAAVPQSTFSSSSQRPDFASTSPPSVPPPAPESQIEVNHDDMDVAEEFFRLTQPPPQNGG